MIKTKMMDVPKIVKTQGSFDEKLNARKMARLIMNSTLDIIKKDESNGEGDMNGIVECGKKNNRH